MPAPDPAPHPAPHPAPEPALEPDHDPARGAVRSSGEHPSRTLWLLRHGEASESTSQGGDMARRLAPRGRRDATALGRRLAAGSGVFGLVGRAVPQVALCSAAVRTRETADLVATAMDGALTVEPYRSLYGAGPDTVLRYATEIDDRHRSALIVGHNPTLFELTWNLLGPEEPERPEDPGVSGNPAGPAEPDDRALLRRHGFPTCGLAVIDLGAGSWADLSAGRGTLVGLFAPPY